jgi:hypothetical protein
MPEHYPPVGSFRNPRHPLSRLLAEEERLRATGARPDERHRVSTMAGAQSGKAPGAG